MKLILCGDICPTELTRPAFDAGDVTALLGGAETGRIYGARKNGFFRLRKRGAVHRPEKQRPAPLLRGTGFRRSGERSRVAGVRFRYQLFFSRLSIFTASFVPSVWNSCTSSTSRITAAYMMRYL